MMRSLRPALVGAVVVAGLIGHPAASLAQSDMAIRLDQLESDMRRLTGQVEDLQYRNQQLEQALRALQGGGAVSARPGSAPAAPVAAPPPGPPPAVPGRRSDVYDPAQNPNAPGAPRVLGATQGSNSAATAGVPLGQQPPEPPAPIASAGQGDDQGPNAPGAPLDLGAMSANAAAGGSVAGPRGPGGAQVATLPPSQSPKDEFDLAYGYVLRKDFAPAAQTFQDFLKRHPNDALAPEAQFWLGESLFQSKNYQSAAEAFVTMTKKFTSSPKQPDTLLRLGQSLLALQQKDLACVTFAEVGKKYPHAAQNVRAAVEREQKRARCS
jgi:tol-pal system protein YbgF